jgi:hypothetical protein
MKIDANIEELKKELENRINAVRSWRDDDKRKSTFVAVYLGLVSAITTVSIGIVAFLPEAYKIFGIISLFSSASVTVVAAWDGLFHHKKLWIHYAMTYNEFRDLERDIRHAEKSPSAVTQDQTNEFYSRFNQIVKDDNKRWYGIRE